MKIRLIGNGYEAFTGFFGTVEFKDGVSVHAVSPADARFFASITSIQDAETGEDPGDNALFERSFQLEAHAETLPTLAELGMTVEQAPVEQKVQAPAEEKYTKERLEELADKGGIAALREIGGKLDVRGTSIAKLIDGILAAQATPEPEAQTFQEGQPDVVTSEEAK